MNNIILYHAGCPDGFGAAFAAWLKFGDAGAQYIPVQYGEPVPELECGGAEVRECGSKSIFIVDFSYPRAVLEELAARPDVRRVVVLDHHKTAQAELGCLPDSENTHPFKLKARFDMSKSGAVLAWEYFHPDKPVPEMFLYLQDRDLWEWKLQDSREINTALWRGRSRQFAVWEKMLAEWDCEYDWSLNRPGLFFDGDLLLNSDALMLSALARDPEQITGPGGEIGLRVNSPVLQSELGEKLLADNPVHEFADVWYERAGKRIHSLRSRKGGTCDVSQIAAHYGGGGHHAAAGYAEKAEILKS